MESVPVSTLPSLKPTRPRFVRWAVVLGIIVVLNIVFVVVRAIAFPAPQFEAYCPASIVNQPSPQSRDACVEAGGEWNTIYAPQPVQKIDGTPAPTGFCDLTSQCSAQWETAQKAYGQKAFALMTVLGVIAIVVGILPIGSSIVSSGLSYGGVVALIIGSGLYWNEAGNWLRLVISLIALAVLVYIGLKRFRD